MRIFISYSHKDEAIKDRLMKHLYVLQLENIVQDVWDDSRIAAGADWRTHIGTAITSADVGVLLISVDFLTSKFIREQEVPELLKRRVFPIIARACPWQEVRWLHQLQVRPKNGKPLPGGKKMDEALASIAIELARVVKAPSGTASSTVHNTGATSQPVRSPGDTGRVETRPDARASVPRHQPENQLVLAQLGGRREEIERELGGPTGVAEYKPTEQDIQEGRKSTSLYLHFYHFGFTYLLVDGRCLTVFLYRAGVERHVGYPHEVVPGLRVGMTRKEIEKKLGRPTSRSALWSTLDYELDYGNLPAGFKTIIRFDTPDGSDKNAVANMILVQKLGTF